MLFPESRRDLCRVGLGIYGLHPCHETKSVVQLRPAMRLVSHVSHVQHLRKRGASQLRADQGAKSGRHGGDRARWVMPMGWREVFLDMVCALIRGRRYPLAGTITMDQVVRKRRGRRHRAGRGEVVFLGNQGDEGIGGGRVGRGAGDHFLRGGLLDRSPSSTSSSDLTQHLLRFGTMGDP